DEGGDEGDDDSDEGCVLAPAAQGARLVCGETAATDALVPYLSRTMPREKWSSDVHLEVRPDPVRAPLETFRSTILHAGQSFIEPRTPALKGIMGGPPGEAPEIAADAQKLMSAAETADTATRATPRFESQSTRSLFARAVTTNRGEAPPAAFWPPPAETD